MALLAAGSALVAGSHPENNMQTKKGRVLRAFYYQGKPTVVGQVVELPRVFALEMAAANKLELLEDPKPEAAAAADAKSKADQKGAIHAR